MKTATTQLSQLSLPPNTEDVVYGKLKLEIGPVHSLIYGNTNYPKEGSNYLLQFHIVFYGEKEAIILRYFKFYFVTKTGLLTLNVLYYIQIQQLMI